jgi:hypothetical protein
MLDAAIVQQRRRLNVLTRPPSGFEDACGAFPVRGLLIEAKRRGLSIERLDLRNSATWRAIATGSSATEPGLFAQNSPRQNESLNIPSTRDKTGSWTVTRARMPAGRSRNPTRGFIGPHEPSRARTPGAGACRLIVNQQPAIFNRREHCLTADSNLLREFCRRDQLDAARFWHARSVDQSTQKNQPSSSDFPGARRAHVAAGAPKGPEARVGVIF